MPMTLEAPRETATKVAYAVIGAPVVTTRKLREAGNRFVVDTSHVIDEWAEEGRKVTEQLQDQKVVEQVQDAVDLDQIQEQVERLRDQLETAMVAWRDSFVPARQPEKAAEEPKKPAAKKPAAKKPAAKKTAAKKTAPKTTAKKTAPKTSTEG